MWLDERAKQARASNRSGTRGDEVLALIETIKVKETRHDGLAGIQHVSFGQRREWSKYVARSLDIIDKSGVAYRLNPDGYGPGRRVGRGVWRRAQVL